MKLSMTEFGLIYLASPYSRYKYGLDRAFRDVATIAGKMLLAGAKVYSPIVHTHPIAIEANINPYDLNIWLPFDEAMMDAAGSLVIAMMLGWDESKGIEHEIDFFRKREKPIYMMDPYTLEIK